MRSSTGIFAISIGTGHVTDAGEDARTGDEDPHDPMGIPNTLSTIPGESSSAEILAIFTTKIVFVPDDRDDPRTVDGDLLPKVLDDDGEDITLDEDLLDFAARIDLDHIRGDVGSPVKIIEISIVETILAIFPGIGHVVDDVDEDRRHRLPGIPADDRYVDDFDPKDFSGYCRVRRPRGPERL